MRSFPFINSLISFLLLTGCASLEDKRGDSSATEKEFEVEKEIAWEALLEVFKPYPKATISEESGFIETEELRGSQVWQPAHTKTQPSGIIYYRLKAVLTEDPPYTYVRIKKTSKRKRDFFSKPETVASDFLEEQALLYRLGREIQIKRLIQKIYKDQEPEEE